MKLKISFTLLMVVMFATAASAATVTFDDVTVSGINDIQTTSINSGGFMFASTHFHITNDPGFCLYGGCVTDGTQYLAEDAPGLALPVTMTRLGGGTFSLASFDGDKLWLDDASAAAGGFGNAAAIHVVGSLFGGGSIIEDFQLDGSPNFQHFVFAPGWNNLESAVWSGLNSAGAGNYSMAVDNINATGSQVPEPGSMILLGSGLAGLAATVFRKLRM